MNSTGKALSQADLVRNFILMGLEPEHQTRLYEDHWRPMEVACGQQGYSEYFDSFMRHYLTVKRGDPRQMKSMRHLNSMPAARVLLKRRRSAG